ncbi:VOC family protein [Yoonia sp. F2084L]|uniref:VOC family protein n=1 Tax=Yoonia sp. F2084L TaxID=2926419 RepID=UPI001FF4CB4B|nr:VOC family protein [Yoonia sp. F2084L]MCK0097013.1 VOC family protein [Yoonia sp. F2084L]
MIGYTMVGTRDLERAIRFYDPLFEEMGIDKAWSDDQVASWGDKQDQTAPRFFTGYPFNEEPATVGNGVMTAFRIEGKSKIDRLYEIAMSKGGSDEGGPSFRPQYHETFYAAYLRDPDGNKIAFFCYEDSSQQ